MRDMATGRARGFGFVEMATDDAAQQAIAKFHQYELEGRQLVVNEARPKPEGGRSVGSSGGFGRGGNRGSGDDFGGGDGGGRREPRW